MSATRHPAGKSVPQSPALFGGHVFNQAEDDELYTAAQPTLDLALDGVGLGEADGAPPPRRAARRYLRTFVRDRRTMLVLLGQVPLIAVLIAALSGSSLLHPPDAEPVKSGQFVEMNARLAGDPPAAAKYGHSFFSLDPVLAIFTVLLFAAAGLAVASLLLRRPVT